MDELELEKRLSKIEYTLSSGFSGVHDRLDELNGQVAKNTSFRKQQEDRALEMKGFLEGRSSVRKKDLAILGVILSVMVTIMNLAAPFIREAL